MLWTMRPAYRPDEIVKAWLSGVVRLEWWMTRFEGSFTEETHRHEFRLIDASGNVTEVRTQPGYFGFAGIDDAERTKLQENQKKLRKALKDV